MIKFTLLHDDHGPKFLIIVSLLLCILGFIFIDPVGLGLLAECTFVLVFCVLLSVLIELFRGKDVDVELP